MKTLMIYGASGYIGRMAAEQAKVQGLDVVIGGRDVAARDWLGCGVNGQPGNARQRTIP